VPRARKPQTNKSSQTDNGGQPDKSKEFVCPECGRTFTRAAALGSHRRNAHNVVGAASQSRAQTAEPATKTSRTPTTTKRRRTGTTTKTTATPAGRSSSPSNGALNRDALLQTLFPNCIPAKENVIRSANSWLDEAERLTRLR
jgi:Zinc finger, C2H2 type